MIAYFTAQTWLKDTSKELVESEKRMDKAIVAYQKAAYSSNIRARDKAFLALFYTYKSNTELLMEAVAESGVLDIYPEQTSLKLLAKASYSFFIEGWMEYVDKAVIDRVIVETDMMGTYQDVAPPELINRHCGSCGSALAVVEGAKKVLCEACGFMVDVEQSELPCPKCAAPVSMPAGHKDIACPYCEAQIRTYN